MRARVEDDILFLHQDDVPEFKKKGSVVRNNYFWALKAIAVRARYEGDWEFDAEVWVALQRIVLAFADSGYLALQETILEFPMEAEIPEPLRVIATRH